jgi:hypothetical protein
MEVEIKYPVVEWTPLFVRGSIQTPRQLLVVGERQLRRGCFADASIVDADGNKYRVLSARIRRRTFSLWNLFAEYRTVWVTLDLQFECRLSLGELRDEVVRLILKNPTWAQHHDETPDQIRKKLSEPTTLAALINRISVYP